MLMRLSTSANRTGPLLLVGLSPSASTGDGDTLALYWCMAVPFSCGPVGWWLLGVLGLVHPVGVTPLVAVWPFLVFGLGLAPGREHWAL